MMIARSLCLFLAVAPAAAQLASGQTNNYKQIDLVSNVPGLALNFDHGLINPWGLAVSSSQPFRIPNEGTGLYQSFDASGAMQASVALVAPPPGHTISRPTGVAANPTNLFVPSNSFATPFLYATEDGTISTEYADQRGDILETTILVIDRSAAGAVYTGLAVLTPDCCGPFLAAANFHSGEIDTFTSFFAPLGIPGAFIDPNLPAGYAPYNLSVIDNEVYVTYAVQDAGGQNAVAAPGNGLVDVYDLAGTFQRRFASHGALNAPWGVVQAGANFGQFSNDILIGNSGDGIINAFDPSTGKLLGQLKDGNGNAIVNLSLHGMAFGAGSTGDANTLYLTAGLGGATNGVFAAIAVNTGAGPDFTLTAPSSVATVAPGQSATFMLTATPVGDFRGIFSFSCTAPGNFTCTVGTTAVNAATGAATISLTATASPMAQAVKAGGAFLPGFAIAGVGLWGFRRARGGRRGPFLCLLAVVVAGLSAVGLGGCGGYAMRPMASPPATANIVVTATTGALTHNTTLSLTVQ